MSAKFRGNSNGGKIIIQAKVETELRDEIKRGKEKNTHTWEEEEMSEGDDREREKRREWVAARRFMEFFITQCSI